MIGSIKKSCSGSVLPVKEQGAFVACLKHERKMAHNSVVPRLGSIPSKIGITIQLNNKALRCSGNKIHHERDVKVRSGALIQGDWGRLVNIYTRRWT
jgi:hypothetical protein